MLRIIYGDRVGKQATLAVVCSSVVFDSQRHKVLLTRRADNGRWCCPGGHMEPGESAAEACARETKEETGLDVLVTKLIGLYSSPDHIAEYVDGNRFQSVLLSFEAKMVGGALQTTDETTECGYFSWDDIEGMDVIEPNLQRIRDAFAGTQEAFIR